MAGGRIFIDADVFMRIFMEEVDSFFHFFLQLVIPVQSPFRKCAPDPEKEFIQQERRALFKARTPGLQFPDDLEKKPGILRGHSRMDNRSVCEKPQLFQNIRNILPGKMDPEYLRVVFYILSVLLWNSGRIKHHMSG